MTSFLFFFHILLLLVGGDSGLEAASTFFFLVRNRFIVSVSSQGDDVRATGKKGMD